MGFGKIKKSDINESKKVPKKGNVDNKFVPYARDRLMFKDPSVKNHYFYSIRFKTNDSEPYSRGEIYKFAQQKSNELATKSPTSVFSVTLKFASGVHKAGKRTIAGANISLWNESDSGDYDQGDIIGFDVIMSLPI